jgi:cytochrome c553
VKRTVQHRSRTVFLAFTFAPFGCCDCSCGGYIKPGRQKALQCQIRHGLDGQAQLPEAPNLACQTEVYLIKSLEDYRAGVRTQERHDFQL